MKENKIQWCYSGQKGYHIYRNAGDGEVGDGEGGDGEVGDGMTDRETLELEMIAGVTYELKMKIEYNDYEI